MSFSIYHEGKLYPITPIASIWIWTNLIFVRLRKFPWKVGIVIWAINVLQQQKKKLHRIRKIGNVIREDLSLHSLRQWRRIDGPAEQGKNREMRSKGVWMIRNWRKMKRKKKTRDNEYLRRLTENLTDLEKTLGREPTKHFRRQFLRSFVKLDEILSWEEEEERA